MNFAALGCALFDTWLLSSSPTCFPSFVDTKVNVLLTFEVPSKGRKLPSFNLNDLWPSEDFGK